MGEKLKSMIEVLTPIHYDDWFRGFLTAIFVMVVGKVIGYISWWF